LPDAGHEAPDVARFTFAAELAYLLCSTGGPMSGAGTSMSDAISHYLAAFKPTRIQWAVTAVIPASILVMMIWDRLFDTCVDPDPVTGQLGFGTKEKPAGWRLAIGV
jgi:hypothetical protein